MVAGGVARERGKGGMTMTDIDNRMLDRRIWLMARAMARAAYPTISDEALESSALHWDGTALTDAECSVWQDFIPEAEAALAALKGEGFVE